MFCDVGNRDVKTPVRVIYPNNRVAYPNPRGNYNALSKDKGYEVRRYGAGP